MTRKKASSIGFRVLKVNRGVNDGLYRLVNSSGEIELDNASLERIDSRLNVLMAEALGHWAGNAETRARMNAGIVG